MRKENLSYADILISTPHDQLPLQNSIIPPTAPVPSAVVAKHSSLQHTADEGKYSNKKYHDRFVFMED